MNEKFLFISTYFGAGLALALWFVFGHPQWLKRINTGGIKRPEHVQAFCARYPGPIGAGLGLFVGVRLLWWWRVKDGLTVPQIVLGAIFIAVALYALSRELNAKFAAPALSLRTKTALAAVAILAIAGIDFSTGFTTDDTTRFLTLHHWTAYVGPAEALRAGGLIYYDFATQYGLGPTLVLAASCGADCWTGMYWVASIFSIAFAAAMVAIVAHAGIRTTAGFAVAMITTVLCCVFWVAFPPFVSTPLAGPSTTGLRFLPAVLLVAVMLWSENNARVARHWQILGSALFAAGALWSPESLFYVTFVWGPYFCARRLAERTEGQPIRAFLWSVALVLITLAATLCTSLAVYRMAYGIWPSLTAYLAYVLYTPGVMPITWHGPIWYVLAALGFGIAAAVNIQNAPGRSSAFRCQLLVLQLVFASMSYTLGRSHSNNFLNLLPFIAALLFFAMARPLSVMARSGIAGMIAMLIGGSVFFGWTGWAQSLRVHQGLEFNPARLSQAHATLATPDAAMPLKTYCRGQLCDPADANRALAYIKQTSGDPASVFDLSFLSLSPKVWNAFHGPANYWFMPPALRRTFLERSASRYKASGWIVMQNAVPAEWLDDYKAFYDVTEDTEFGTYRAIHLKWRPAP